MSPARLVVPLGIAKSRGSPLGLGRVFEVIPGRLHHLDSLGVVLSGGLDVLLGFGRVIFHLPLGIEVLLAVCGVADNTQRFLLHLLLSELGVSVFVVQTVLVEVLAAAAE